MKYYRLIGRMFLLIVLLTMLSCDSDPSSSGSSSCGDPYLRLREISFVLDGTLYDFDSLPGLFMMIEKRWDWSGSDFTIKFTKGGDWPEWSLLFKLPKYKTGSHLWHDRSTDSTAYGFQFEIDSLSGANAIQRYCSVLGSTNIVFYDNPGDIRDSLFGTFCGKVRDDAGAILEVSDGRFYFIDQ